MSYRSWVGLVLVCLWATATPVALDAAHGDQLYDGLFQTASDEPSASGGLDPVDVALDPGHSTWDVGASGGGLREYELTLDVAQRARARLEASGYRVRLTRETNQRVAPTVPADLTEATRVEQFARHQAAGPAKVFVSVHFNGHPDRTLRGTETYFNADNFGDESRLLATYLQAATLQALAEAGYSSADRGVREDLTAGKPYGHFFSLRGPFPSALIEALFLSNFEEAALLQQTSTRDAVADGIARGISSYLVHSSQAD
jgi:N-acetylmuramoyl-L-alanine amidase